jgi:apolipoprotein N-acyltransferase
MKNIRLIVIAICLITIAVCGYQMSQLPLWGYWTLPFLVAIWTLVVALFYKKYNPRWLALSTLSGLLLGIGFPNSPLTPLMFLGFVPLLLIEKELNLYTPPTENTSKILVKSSFFKKNNNDGLLKYAYNAFVIYNILATWWVGNAGLAAGMIANFLNAFFMAIPFWLFHKTNKVINPAWTLDNNILQKVYADEVLKYGAFIVYWLAFEYVHLNWEISWPWLTLGNAFAQYPSWIQWYEYTGTTGGSLWILLLNVLIFNILDKKYFRKERYTKNLIQAGAWLVIPLSISALIFSNVQTSTGKTANVVSVQPNYEPHYEKFEVPESVQFQKFMRLSLEKVDSATDYLIFPETSFDFNKVDTWRNNTIVQELQNVVNRYPKLHLVMGIDAMKIYAAFAPTKPEGLANTVREYDNKDGTFTYWESYNAATQIASGIDTLPLYKKSKLVPGAEILPYGALFAWLKPLFRKFGGTVGGLGKQEERSVFWNKRGHIAVAPLICYESIYSDYCTGYVQKGANALFIVTNDGWWDDTPGYIQHQKFASLRAIELRRPVVRSANTGSSCFIDILGNITQATLYAKDAVIADTILLNDKRTFYAIVGDILGRTARNLSIGFLIGLLLRSFFLRKGKDLPNALS